MTTKQDEHFEQLSPEQFTIEHVIERIQQIGNPWKDFREVGERQKFQTVIEQLGGGTFRE